MITLAEVLASTGGTVATSGATVQGFSQVQIDSRAVQAGDLFVAVRGEVQDGHRYVPAATAQGARGALITRGRASEFAAQAEDCLLIEVADPLLALGALAQAWRQKYPIPIVGITGSVGKSSTKELTAGLLGTHWQVLKSPKSYNNEFGLPLSVLMIDQQTDVAVLEMGTFGPGELTYLAEIAAPTIAVVTNVGHTHLERMGSQDGIARAKGELVAALPATGTAILNGDDSRVAAMAALTVAPTLTYGQGNTCQLRATDLVDHGLDGLSFMLHWQGEQATIDHAPLLGAHSVYTALAAAAVALTLGLTFAEVVAGLHQPYAATRLLVVPGVGGATLIDDSYNAAPASVLAALGILAQVPAQRRLAVLGDMLELGEYEAEAHQIVGREVAQVVDQLLTIGPRARMIAAEAVACGLPADQVRQFERKDEVVAILQAELGAGDVVLIKGSRGLALEDLVAALREVQPC